MAVKRHYRRLTNDPNATLLFIFREWNELSLELIWLVATDVSSDLLDSD